MYPIKQLIQSTTDWLLDFSEDGYSIYYVNFMFHPLGFSQRAILPRMAEAIDRFYSTLVKRFTHHPKALAEQARLPLMMLWPDLPVMKGKKKRVSALTDVTINEGLHYNGFLLVPPRCRFNHTIQSVFDEQRDRYCRNGIRRIKVLKADDLGTYVADYAAKTLKRNSEFHDATLIYPRTLSELG